jgi:immunoglobulin-binding protein 1
LLLESYSILPVEPKKAATAAETRAAKISEYKLQKTLTTKIADLESRLDEEDLRQWALSSIELAVLHSRQNLKNIEMELEVLASRPSIAPQPQQTETRYSERLDRIPASGLPKSGPLLSGEGRVLRPFVLTSKRDQLAQGVFRPDHALPTMSIDNYLTEEIQRGGIQIPQEEDSKANADRQKSTREEEEEEDRETEKKREWDDYVESHAKGSGNMGFNRG